MKCPICSFESDYLIDHLQKEHDLSVEEFRTIHGFNDLLFDPKFYDLLDQERKSKNIQREGNLVKKSYFSLFDIKVEKLHFNSRRKFVPELDNAYYFPKCSRWAMIAIKERKNVFLTGLPGTGKSSLIMQIYARLNRSLYHISSFGDLTYEHLIYKDELKVNPENGKVETRPQYGTIIQSMLDKENKAGLLFDEISFADSRVLQALQPLLEGSTRYLTIPETGEIIRAHPDWVFFATDNTKGQGDEFGMFSGAENMNFALLNRFPIFLELDYLPLDVEEKVLKEKIEQQGIDLPLEVYKRAMQVTRLLRNGVKSNKYYMTFSIRDVYEWLLKLKYFDRPFSAMIECAKITFVNKLDEVTKQGVLNVLEDVLGK